MQKSERHVAIAVIGFFAISPPAHAQANLLKNDAALMRSATPSNWELWRVLGPCKGLKLHRSAEKGMALFRIDGVCRVKNPPAPDEDCLSYSLDASGTIDTPTNATIRKVTLRLLCAG